MPIEVIGPDDKPPILFKSADPMKVEKIEKGTADKRREDNTEIYKQAEEAYKKIVPGRLGQNIDIMI